MNKFSIGVSEIDVTPDAGVPLGGFARYRPASSVRDRLKVKCLALRHHSRTVLIVSADAVAVPNHMVQRLRLSAAREIGIGADSMLVSASHTHSAPDTIGFASTGNRRIAVEYLRFLEGAILEASRRALRESSLAQAYFATGKTIIGFNRVHYALRNEVYRALLKTRLLRYLDRLERFSPIFVDDSFREGTGPVDPNLDVIWFEVRGKPRAAIVNYACHPTVLGPRSKAVSGDYPAELAARIAYHFGEPFATLFINGASGNVNPRSCRGYSCNGTTDDLKELGRILGDEAVRAIRENSAPMEASLDVRSCVVSICGSNSMIHSIRIGDRFISAIPGELFVETGLDIRDRTGGKVLLASCANGYMGYLPPEMAFRFRCRETERTWWNRAEQGCAERISRALSEMVNHAQKIA